MIYPIDEPFLHEVTPVIIEGLADAYPELPAAREAILEIGRLEEQRFAETLTTGLSLLEKSLSAARKGATEQPVLAGRELFRLYDTFGFPLDLARDIAERAGRQRRGRQSHAGNNGCGSRCSDRCAPTTSGHCS